MNHTIHRNFLDDKTRDTILEYVDSINETLIPTDHHLKHLVSKLNGSSYMYDIGKTELTNKIAQFQSGGNIMTAELPCVFHELVNQLSHLLNIPNDQAFLQIVDMNYGGTIGKHYDASFEGYVNYKCNISVLSKDYDFAIDKSVITVKQSDLYCFEASLYKHWTPVPFTTRRVLLSFGFLVPYSSVGRSIEDPRVRLSQRIQKYFQI